MNDHVNQIISALVSIHEFYINTFRGETINVNFSINFLKVGGNQRDGRIIVWIRKMSSQRRRICFLKALNIRLDITNDSYVIRKVSGASVFGCHYLDDVARKRIETFG